MGSLDLIALVGVVVLLLVIGLTGDKRPTSTQDYFLAGRDLQWWQIGFSLFATNFSAATLIGLTGAAYAIGIAIYNYEWVGILAMLLFALILVGDLRRSRVYTIAQYLEERFDHRIKIAYSVFLIFLIIFIEMAGALYAGGVLLHQAFPFISLEMIIFLIMLMAGAYSILGGLRAIARTDVMQTVLILFGALLVTYFTFKAAGGWQAMVEKAPAESLSLIRGRDDRAVPWTGLISGVPVLCIYFWMVNQSLVQWVLSARSEVHAARGLVMAGVMKIFVLFIIIIPGVAAVSLFPDIGEPDQIYPVLLFELLPVGILGLVMAGFIAAIMSSADSTLHAASTIITMDIVKPHWPQLSVARLVWVGRITTGIIILISAVWAPMIGRFGTLFEYIQALLSYAVAPFVVVYLAGWFWQRATATGALLALCCGMAAALGAGLLPSLTGADIHYLHVPLPIALISLLGLITGSLMTAPSQREERLYHQKLTDLQKGDYGLMAAVFALVIVQVGLFF